MLADCVVDTNVMEHAQNPGEPKFADANCFLEGLLACLTKLCVDPGFSLDRSRNRSRIGHEYRERLRFGSVGLNAVVKLVSDGRVVEVADVPARATQIARRTLPPPDRAFLRVAAGSTEKVLVTHDDHFHGNSREYRSKLSVSVVEASEGAALL